MRIISGKYKSRRLKSPKGYITRPTEDKVKESIFNAIEPIKPESTVLDAFSGTGSIGLEFLSRGAKSVYFVENNKYSFAVLKENVESIDEEKKCSIIMGDVLKICHKFYKDGIKFSYIYIDPPYEKHDLYDKIIEKICAYNLLYQDSIILIEHEKDFRFKYESNFALQKQKDYKTKIISVYRFKGDNIGSNISGQL